MMSTGGRRWSRGQQRERIEAMIIKNWWFTVGDNNNNIMAYVNPGSRKLER